MEFLLNYYVFANLNILEYDLSKYFIIYYEFKLSDCFQIRAQPAIHQFNVHSLN